MSFTVNFKNKISLNNILDCRKPELFCLSFKLSEYRDNMFLRSNFKINRTNTVYMGEMLSFTTYIGFIQNNYILLC
jgi:hypothetical protein